MQAARTPVVGAVADRDPSARFGGVAGSVTLHALLLVAILLSPPVQSIVRKSEEAIAVVIVPPATAPSPSVEEILAVPETAPALRPASAGYVRATSMLSARALADPRSARAREAMTTLDASERIVQLCNIEALQQIAGWRRDLEPDLVVPYARRNLSIQDGTIRANGAAVHIGEGWFDLKFNCELSVNGASVNAFEFHLGEAIPAAVWDELGLPEAVDDEDDG